MSGSPSDLPRRRSGHKFKKITILTKFFLRSFVSHRFITIFITGIDFDDWWLPNWGSPSWQLLGWVPMIRNWNIYVRKFSNSGKKKNYLPTDSSDNLQHFLNRHKIATVPFFTAFPTDFATFLMSHMEFEMPDRRDGEWDIEVRLGWETIRWETSKKTGVKSK